MLKSLSAALVLALGSMSAQAAVTVSSKLDLASTQVIGQGGATGYTFAAYYAAEAGFVPFGGALSTSFSVTEGVSKTLSSAAGSLGAVSNDDRLQNDASLAYGDATVISRNFFTLSASSSGTFTIRIPYTVELTRDSLAEAATVTFYADYGAPNVVNTVYTFDDVAFAKTASGFVEYDVTADEITHLGGFFLGNRVQVTAVPEPETYALLAMGFAGIATARRWSARRR